MKDLYSRFTEDELWIVKENEWEKALQNIRETQFSIGNGYIGTRAVLEELPSGSIPGTYLSGVYDKLAAQVDELVNFPNPFNFRLSVGGERIGVETMDTVTHKRAINMKKGILVRNSRLKASQGVRFDLGSIRFLSMADKNLGAMQVVITPLDSDCVMDVQTGIDTSVFNVGTVTEGKKKHFRLKELGQTSDAGFLVAETFEKKHIAVYWGGFYYDIGGKRVYAKDNIFDISLKKGQTVIFTKIFRIKHFPADRSHVKCKEQVFKKFHKELHSNFEDILGSHIKAWEKTWEKQDIQIKGTANLQIIMRFNIYHMLICAHVDDGFSSIGARTLSGEGYRGHIFWDVEIFLFPYYLFTDPAVAKNMLLYRYNRIEAARTIAKENGYKGAMFPWESASTGFDQTPSWAKDINGQIVEIFTNKMEHHITPDIAYATSQYYTATGDKDFMKKAGYELLLSTARFCVSRLEYNKKKKIYEISGVIGPDEFHIDVRNNAFTNTMFRWNILEGVRTVSVLKKEFPALWKRLAKKLGITDAEVSKWKNIASKIKKPNINKDGIIEQHDGYFKLKNIVFEDMDENGVPVLPEKFSSIDMGQTQFIKQCDVLMLLYLLPQFFDKNTLKSNYKYYIMRTAHKSSLSASTSSLVGARCGDLYRAYHLFNMSLRADISNLYANTHEGTHAASLGGTYQSLIFGFAGLSYDEGCLYVNPKMPRTWEKLVFNFCWKGCQIYFEVGNRIVKLKVKGQDKKKIALNVFGNEAVVSKNRTYTFEKQSEKIQQAFYY